MKKFAKGLLIVASIALVAAGCTKTETATNTANTNVETKANSNTDTPTNTATGQTKTFNVNGDNFKFAPNEIKVNEGDTVVINFKNTGGFHDWVLDEFNAKTQQLGDGASETVTFVANKKGTFEYYCSVGQHRQMGMKGNLIVE